MKLNEADREEFNRIREAVRDGQRNISDKLYEVVGNAQKFLFLVNAGASIALLSFMGSSQAVREAPIAWVALTCFCGGIVCVGVLNAFNFHTWFGIAKRLNADARAVLYAEIDVEEFDRRRTIEKRRHWPLAIAYLAFAFFVGGSGIGIWGLLPLASTAGKPVTVSTSAPPATPATAAIPAPSTSASQKSTPAPATHP